MMTTWEERISNMLQQETLTDHLVLFFRDLREEGFLIGSNEMTDGIQALQSIDISEYNQFKLVLQIVLCSTKEEHDKFDSLFQNFFFKKEKEDLLHFHSEVKEVSTNEKSITENNQSAESVENPEEQKKQSLPSFGFHKDKTESETDGQQEGATLYTALNAISKKTRTFKVRIPAHHFSTMEKAAEQLTRRFRLLDSRRKKVLKNGNTFDMRRTFRKSIQTGGYPINPVHTGPISEKSSFILLCDSSRSMATYSKIYLQFAYALMQYSSKVEVFLFSTRLRRVTDQITTSKRGAFPVLHVQENEWEGGTCIGESLNTFVQMHGLKMVNKNTIVMIASDGLDTGNSEHLQQTMREIRKRSTFIIWFNPLLNLDGYEPTASGMKIALPHIDVFSHAMDAHSFMELSNQVKVRR